MRAWAQQQKRRLGGQGEHPQDRAQGGRCGAGGGGAVAQGSDPCSPQLAPTPDSPAWCPDTENPPRRAMTSSTSSPRSSRTQCPHRTMVLRVGSRGEGGGVVFQAESSTSLPTPASSVPAAAARPHQAGQLPARAPGARTGATATAAGVAPPFPGWRPAHPGRLRPAAQAAHSGRTRGPVGWGQESVGGRGKPWKRP